MRILHVSDTYQPLVGGIEVLVDDLSSHQRRSGHQVRVLTSTPGAGPGADSGPAPGSGPALGPGADDPSTIRLASPVFSPVNDILRSFRPDVVHCHSSIVSPLAWRTARHAARAGFPVVVTMHSMMPGSGPVSGSLRRLAQWMPPEVAWSAVSSSAAAALQPVVGRPVHVLPNGMDLDRCQPARPGTNEIPFIVSVMRLARRKRPLELLGILARIKAQLGDRPWRAAIVGDGPLKPAVQRSIRWYGLEQHVHLTGSLTRPQVIRMLARADVFLAPAHLESFGIAALEARCSALPVVAMSSGGVGEFIQDGIHGYLVRDDTEMAARAAGLLADPLALQAMGRRSRVDPPDLGWASIVERNLDAYRSASLGALAGARIPAKTLVGSSW